MPIAIHNDIECFVLLEKEKEKKIGGFLFFLSPSPTSSAASLQPRYLILCLALLPSIAHFTLHQQVESSSLDITGFPTRWSLPEALVLVPGLCILDPPQAEACFLLSPRDMANSMNGFDLDYSATNRDDEEDVRDGVLQSSLMDFPGSYAFSAMLPHDGDLNLPSFDRPGQQQGDLEGRLPNVMLTYDSIPSTGVSMPMSLDASNAFAFDVPTSYPSTTMGLSARLDQPQLQNVFSPFAQSMDPSGQYLQQPSAPQSRKDAYNTATGSSGSYEDSDFSRTSDRSQMSMSRPSQRFPQYGQQSSYRSLQPVAIQPKKPAAVKGEFCVPELTR